MTINHFGKICIFNPNLFIEKGKPAKYSPIYFLCRLCACFAFYWQRLWLSENPASQYYISQYSTCWDFGGMTIQDLKCVGIDPNSCRPKPRPSTPINFFDLINFLYQKQMNVHFKDLCVGILLGRRLKKWKCRVNYNV